jgi:biopolymer transport protein ExbD
MYDKYSQSDEEAQIDMTPMLDVVFIMLIFFIVTSSFVKETGVDVSRPSAQTAVTTDAGSVQIGITASDEIWIDKRRIDPRAVRANVEKALAENPGSGVVIVADEGSNTSVLIKVMDQARLAGSDNVSVAAKAL